MTNLFFDHLVIREELDFELNKYPLSVEERADLIAIIDQTLDHTILNVVLNHLPKDRHPEFADHLAKHPHHEQIMDFLKIHTTVDIEAEIKKHARLAKDDIMSEIRKSKIPKK